MSHQKPACTVCRYDVTPADLPVSCPLPNMRLWDAHPKVFLSLEETGHATCPYCGTAFFMADFDPKQA